MLVRFKTDKGVICQHLINTEGPKMLWAIGTEAVDRTLRSEVMKRLGSIRDTRAALAAYLPSGSVKPMLEKRRALNESSYEHRDDSLLDTIAAEVVENWLRRAPSR